MIRKFVTCSFAVTALVLGQSLFAQFNKAELEKIVPADAQTLAGISLNSFLLHETVTEATKLNKDFAEARAKFDKALAGAGFKLSDIEYIYVYGVKETYAAAIKTKVKVAQFKKALETVEDDDLKLVYEEPGILKIQKEDDPVILVFKEQKNNIILFSTEQSINWATAPVKQTAPIVAKCPQNAANALVWAAVIPMKVDVDTASASLSPIGPNDITFIDFELFSTKKDFKLVSNIQAINADKANEVKKMADQMMQMFGFQFMNEPELLQLIQKAVQVKVSGNTTNIQIDYPEALSTKLTAFLKKASQTNDDIGDLEIDDIELDDITDDDCDDCDDCKKAVPAKKMEPAKVIKNK